MGKLIFYIILAVLIYWVIKGRRPKPPKPESLTQSIDTVCCEYCGVYLPRDEAIHHHDHYFCSNDHRNLYLNSSS